jgi:anaerobic dimethyl sulfoxide reductase subunit C
MIPEGSLVLFTLASELACGLALAAALLDLFGRTPEAPAAARKLAILAFPVALAAMAASLFHLGRPFSAWRAILNWRTSPLSAEILFFALFLGASFLCAVLWLTRRSQARRIIGALTAALGIAAVTASSMVYLVPGRAPWNSGWVPLSFLGSTLVLGAMTAISFGGLAEKGLSRRLMLSGGAVGGLAVALSAAWMFLRMSGSGLDAYGTAQLRAARSLILADSGLWLALFALLAGILPIAFSILGRRSAKYDAGFGKGALLAAIAGLTIGRVLMFAAGTRIPLF